MNHSCNPLRPQRMRSAFNRSVCHTSADGNVRFDVSKRVDGAYQAMDTVIPAENIPATKPGSGLDQILTDLACLGREQHWAHPLVEQGAFIRAVCRCHCGNPAPVDDAGQESRLAMRWLVPRVPQKSGPLECHPSEWQEKSVRQNAATRLLRRPGLVSLQGFRGRIMVR